MADQRMNAGNIGDVIKHAMLPLLVTSFGASLSDEWTYCETHAGYYDYPLAMLKNGGSWKGERDWSVGVLERSGRLPTLGEYASELSRSLTKGVYPGSIRLIASLEGQARPTRILGWDIGDQQVASFSMRHASVTVELGDGYSSIESLKDGKRLVFCDPFWTDAAENTKVQTLIEREPAVVVWYPLTKSSDEFREWLSHQSHPSIEIRYRNYAPKKNGWAGQNMQGAGMMFKGLPTSACDGVMEIGRGLEGIFENEKHIAKERKAKGGGLLIAERDLSLRLALSF